MLHNSNDSTTMHKGSVNQQSMDSIDDVALICQNPLSDDDLSGELVLCDSLDDEDETDTQDLGASLESITAQDRQTQAKYLLVVLLEYVCSTVTPNHAQNKRLFETLCDKLVQIAVVEPLLMREEVSTVRSSYKMAFIHLLEQSIQIIGMENSNMLAITNGVSHSHSGELKSLSRDAINPRMHSILNMPRDHVIFENPLCTSRYSNDFVELTPLGRGGYGTVFRVRHRLDGIEYAVKKVPLNDARPALLLKALREVKSLAKLEGPHLVRYYSAWFEYAPVHVAVTRRTSHPHLHRAPLPTLLELADGPTPTPPCSQSQSLGKGPPPTTLKVPPRKHRQSVSTGEESTDDSWSSVDSADEGEGEDLQWMDQDDLALDDGTSNWDPKFEVTGMQLSNWSVRSIPDNLFDFGTTTISEQSTSKRSSSGQSSSTGSTSRFHDVTTANHQPLSACVIPRKSLHLFIQMQLCDSTLSIWLKERNDGCVSGEEWKVVNGRSNNDIMSQLLEGVAYFHAKGHLHRDLKPGNIFLVGNNHEVRIGDFGLVTDCLEPHVVKADKSALPTDWTTGVGTSSYASPEQLNGGPQTPKCDIYSLGIILFELFCPMVTSMERATLIRNVRLGLLPNSIIQHFPKEAALVRWMTSPISENRPDAVHLVQYFGEDSPLLRHEQVHVSTDWLELCQQLHEKDILIGSLQKELCDQRELIAKQQSMIDQLKTESANNHNLSTDPDPDN